MPDDAADREDTLAVTFEFTGELGGAIRRDHCRHADAAVERAGEFRRGHAGCGEPPEHSRQRPAGGIDLAAEAGRKHAWNVADQPAPGDMRERL